MLAKSYTSRYAVVISLSLLLHVAVMLYLLWNPIASSDGDKTTKSVTVQLKQKQKTNASQSQESEKTSQKTEKTKQQEQEKKKEQKEKEKQKPEASPKKKDAEQQKPRKQEAKKQEAKKQEAKKQEAKKQEAKKQEAKKQEAKKQEAKKQEAKKQEAKKQEAKKQEAKKQEAKKQEAKKQEGQQEKSKKQEPKKQESEKPQPTQSVKGDQDGSKEKSRYVSPNKHSNQMQSLIEGEQERRMQAPRANDAEFFHSQIGTMRMLDDSAMSRTVVVSKSVDARYEKRDQEGRQLKKSLNRVQLQEFNAYLQRASQEILQYLDTSELPMKDGKRYRGDINFFVDENGYIEKIFIKRLSGNAQLDQAMLNMLKRASRQPITMPRNEVLRKAIYSNKMRLFYDESDMR